MPNSFFNNPFWQNFQDRRLHIVSLSEPEHRVRDALALMRLHDFLPKRQCVFERVTIGGPEPRRLPPLQEGDGLVLLGRPSLFGDFAERLLTELSPPLLLRFGSENPADGAPYRTISGSIGPSHESTPYDRGRSKRQEQVNDYAIVYSGWKKPNPVMILAGTSTVGTWGAAQYAASAVDDLDDPRWQHEIQCVIRASVSSSRSAFWDVTAERETDATATPARIWMQGKDLPPWNGWSAVSKNQGLGGAKGEFELDILVNGRKILDKAATYRPALILLAWVGHPNRRWMRSGYCATTTPGEIHGKLTAFFQKECVERAYVTLTLQALTKALRRNGAMAYVEHGEPNRYFICARELPSYLAHWDR